MSTTEQYQPLQDDGQRSTNLAGARRLRVDFPAGTVLIEPATDDVLTAVLRPQRDGDRSARALVAESRLGSRSDEVYVEVPRSGWGRSSRLLLVVQLPDGADVAVRTGSGDVSCSARAGDVRAEAGSADISVAAVAGAAEVKVGSGAIHLGDVAGDLRVRSGAGDIEVQGVGGNVQATTGSGHIRIEHHDGASRLKAGSGSIAVRRSGGDVAAASGSGDVSLERVEGRGVHASTASGDVRIGVPRGVRVWLDLHTTSGSIGSELGDAPPPDAGTPTLEVRARTVSGDIEIVRD